MAPQNSEMSRWIDRTVSVRESFGDAVDLLVRNGYEEEAVEIAANTWRLWIVARDDERGSKFLSAALEATKKKASRSRALALYGNGLFAYRQGKLEDSLRKNQEALEIAEKIKDPEALALANLGLSRAVYEQGDYKHAFSLSAKTLELTRTLDPSMRQAPLFMNALSARMLGDYDTAADLFRKSVELNRTLGDKGMVTAELQNLGLVETHLGQFDRAEKHFREAEALGSSGDSYGDAMVHFQKAIIAFGKKQHDQARQLLTISKSMLEKAGIQPTPDDKFEIEWLDQHLQH